MKPSWRSVRSQARFRRIRSKAKAFWERARESIGIEPGTVRRAVLVASLALTASAQTTTTVGMPARIEQLVLPGPELEVAPTDLHTPVIVRIVATWPHGDAFRYDLEYWGLDPGDYDLAKFLRRKNGAPDAASALPAIPVKVESILPPGMITPHTPGVGGVRALGGYRTLLIVGGIAWFGGLLVLLLAGRKRRRAELASRARPMTLAERLRPLVERARAGTLSRRDRSQLELGLVAFWRRKLALDERRPDEALVALRADERAGPLLRSLEQWLHAPASAESVDVSALLEPYRDLPADALELESHRARN